MMYIVIAAFIVYIVFNEYRMFHLGRMIGEMDMMIHHILLGQRMMAERIFTEEPPPPPSEKFPWE